MPTKGATVADGNRMDQLIEKRSREGLTDEEANELGKLYAEQEGKPYSNAQMRRHGEFAASGAETGPTEPEPQTVQSDRLPGDVSKEPEPPPKARAGEGQPAAERPVPPDELEREVSGDQRSGEEISDTDTTT